MKKTSREKTELEKRLEAKAGASAQEAGGVEQPLPAAPRGPELSREATASLIEECAALKDQLLRVRAEFDNYRKRVAREAERNRKTAAESLVRELLPVIDNLERALDHTEAEPAALVSGVELVLRQFHEALSRNGVERIPAVGRPFDPDMHEAVLQTESADVPANVVALELEKGYRLGERVLRHAKVGVSLGAEALPNDQVRAPAETIEPELGAGPTYPDDLTQEDTGISPDI